MTKSPFFAFVLAVLAVFTASCASGSMPAQAVMKANTANNASTYSLDIYGTLTIKEELSFVPPEFSQLYCYVMIEVYTTPVLKLYVKAQDGALSMYYSHQFMDMTTGEETWRQVYLGKETLNQTANGRYYKVESSTKITYFYVPDCSSP